MLTDNGSSHVNINERVHIIFCSNYWINSLICSNIRVQQRNGKKFITTIQGLATDLNIKKLLKAFKRNFKCNGAIIEDPELGNIIQLQGDQRQNVRDFLIDEEINEKDAIVIHGS